MEGSGRHVLEPMLCLLVSLAGKNDDEDTALRAHLTATTSGSEACCRGQHAGVAVAVTSHRSCAHARGLRPDAQRRDPGSEVFARGLLVSLAGKYLEGNLQALLDRAKSGTYRAPPVRRTYFAEGEPAAKPEGRRKYQTTGHTDVRRQGASARGGQARTARAATELRARGAPGCWRLSTSRTSWTAPMAFGPVARRAMRFVRFNKD